MPSSLGAPEILVILVVALIILGPKKLPEAGRQIGKALTEVRRWTQSVQTEIRDVIDVDPTPTPSPPSYPTPPSSPPAEESSTAAPSSNGSGSTGMAETPVDVVPPAGVVDPPGDEPTPGGHPAG